MIYTGTLIASDKLIIDTENLTATFNGANALPSYNGVFPKLAVGDNTIAVPATGEVTVKWYNRFI